MFWQVGIICYAFKQYELYGHVSNSMLVSVLIQSVYLAKFYYWETGYFCSMDIQHDRAGYYICWGCLVWVPCTYTLATYYLVEHPIALSSAAALSILIAGVLCIWINYDCDRYVRRSIQTLTDIINLIFIVFNADSVKNSDRIRA